MNKKILKHSEILMYSQIYHSDNNSSHHSKYDTINWYNTFTLQATSVLNSLINTFPTIHSPSPKNMIPEDHAESNTVS